jgi:hypothetical protein
MVEGILVVTQVRAPTFLPHCLFSASSRSCQFTKSRTFEITMSVIVDVELKEELKEVLEFSCCTMKR